MNTAQNNNNSNTAQHSPLLGRGAGGEASFLSLVAHDLFQKYGTDLSRVAVVFPNKRASLFFNEYLAKESDRPMWSPAYISISELYQQLSTLKLGDPIRLVCELYKVFREETMSEETLDDFYFWGELLISDFDDLDKHRVDADQLFSNLQDLKKIMEGFDYLSEEQVEAIRRFFQGFSAERRSELKEKFVSLWDKLGFIYRHFRQNLWELGIAYEGMLHRNVIETLQPEQLEYERYVFVGFNVLNKVEQDLFSLLMKEGKALFYWDYDEFYTYLPQKAKLPYTHEAGEFILQNLNKYPNELGKEHFDVMRKPKQVHYISAPTENAQARYLPQWIRGLREKGQGTREKEEPSSNELVNLSAKDTAVVLCNESLLLPVLHSIPEEVRSVNVTMGFPLVQTPVYSFISNVVKLQTDGYRVKSGRYTYNTVVALLKHPYTRQLSPYAEELEKQLTRDNRFYPLPSELQQDAFLEQLFTPQNGNAALCRQLTELIGSLSALYRKQADEAESDVETGELKEAAPDSIFDQLYRESLFKAYTLTGRLLSLIEEGDLTGVRTDTFRRLLTRLMTTATIPFHGEPAIGMQVMGVLETRTLDFRNLIMLSVNEGQLPKGGNDSSFIPYNLRKAFGMTTIEHKNAVYAYYFYRLIQRAENITLMYNTSTDGLNRGEMSRFMLQYLVEAPQEIKKYYLEAGQTPKHTRPITIDKTEEMLEGLRDAYDLELQPKRYLSPSALNAYLDCSMKFYYRYVAGIRMPDEVSAEIDSALFGTIFHRSAQLAYSDLTAHSKEVSREDLEQLLKEHARVQEYVDLAFKEHFFHVPATEQPEYNGTQLIHARVIASYLRQLLRHDLQYAPFRMEGMEQPVRETMEIDTSIGRVTLQIGGTIDRLDSKAETLRIVDYKTGGIPKTPESIGQLFTPAEGRPNYIFQTFLYAAVMCRQQPLKVAPALLYIHRAASESYTPIIEMGPARQPKIPVNNFALYEEDFRTRLKELLEEIFDKEVPFTQTEAKRQCQWCDYRRLCQ